MHKRIYIITLILLSIWACKKVDVLRITKVTSDEVIVEKTQVSAIGTIIDQAKEGVATFGHCWSTNINPSIDDNKTTLTDVNLGSAYTSNISNVNYNTTYYIRSYAKEGEQITYGEQQDFNINDISNISITSSQLQIEDESTLSIDGSITGLNSLSVLDYGHCWSTNSAPTINDSLTSLGALNTEFNYSTSISDLSQNVNYYVRAYVKLDASTVVYSNELSTLISDLEVTTNNNFITGSSALLTGTIVSLGVLPVTDHGHCWSTTTSTPSINNNVISLGATTTAGTFDTNLSSLLTGTTYYYCAYAIKNGNTIKYGAIQSFSF